MNRFGFETLEPNRTEPLPIVILFNVSPPNSDKVIYRVFFSFMMIQYDKYDDQIYDKYDNQIYNKYDNKIYGDFLTQIYNKYDDQY